MKKFAGLCVFVVAIGGAAASDPASTPTAGPTQLLIAHGEVDGFATEIAIAAVDPSKNLATVKPLATINHTHGSAIRGAVRGDVAFVVASEEAPRNTSYDGALYRVEAGRATRLCGGIARASTPIVTSAGRVIVARGTDGADPPAADAQKLILRTDTLTIDDVDPSSGAIRTLWSGTGYQTFLAGITARDEVIAYHSQPSGTEIVVVDGVASRVSARTPAPAFARDFSLRNNTLVFANLNEVRALDLTSFALKTLYVSAHDHPMPFALPTGDVALSSDGDKGLAILQAGQHRLMSPLGDGSDAATHSDGRWVAVRHTSKLSSDPPLVVAWDPLTNKTVRLDVPSSHFVEALGFSGGAR
jgi:hypothetical protein